MLFAATMDLSTIDTLTDRVIACTIAVRRELGPGLLESVYRDCLVYELTSEDLHLERERRVPIGIGAGASVTISNSTCSWRVPL